MAETVKRTYSSALRTEQARATRRAIVAAAAELFVRDGYGATTVDAIAAAAGVSRKTVFTSVGGKLEALKLARDWAIVGDDEPVPMLQRARILEAQQMKDAREVVRDYVAMFVESCSRVAELNGVIESAAGLDEDVRALSEEGWTQRRFGMGKLAEQLNSLGALRADLDVDAAGDLLWVFNDTGLYRNLVITRGWPVDRFVDWLDTTLMAQLIRPGYKPQK